MNTSFFAICSAWMRLFGLQPLPIPEHVPLSKRRRAEVLIIKLEAKAARSTFPLEALAFLEKADELRRLYNL